MDRLKVYIHPNRWHETDRGDGGVRRVVEAQRQHLPAFGIDVVDTPEEADVLAAHMIAPPQFLSLHRDKPLVAHNHGFYWSEYTWGNWANIDNAEVLKLVKAADIVTAPSEWVAEIIRRETSRDTRVVYHGVEPIDPSPDAGLAGTGYALWNKTRVDPVCDPTPVRELAQRLPRVNFVSTFWQSNDENPGTTGAPANVSVTGRVPYDHAIALVRDAGVYLCTARETFGIGTLEAMTAGVPVVGYRWGGQTEFIEHLKDGYLVEPGDVLELARGVLWALQYRDIVGTWAREKAAAFTWPRAAEEYAEIYREAYRNYSAHNGAPAVSIIVPAYNLGAYLPDALKSVQTQTVADWECIVVDDASPDACGAIAESFAADDPRFRVIHNERNLHLSESRNVGIRDARGRYVLPLDADDKLAPNAVELLTQALDADRELWIAYGGVRFVDEDGVTPTVYPGREQTPGYSGWPIPFDLPTLLHRPGQPMPYASMYRRDAWRLTGGYRPRVRSSEDCDFWMRTASYGFTPRQVSTAPTLLYRNRVQSMSRTDGWADVENKAWYPWRTKAELLPAAAQTGNTAAIPGRPAVISVVIPVGPAHASLVRDAVDSVDAQTFRRWECIVVNDTGAPLPELPAWVRVLDSLPADVGTHPAGVVAARNRGAAAAQGDWLLFLDADDYLMPDAMELLIAAGSTPEGPTVVYSDFWSEYTDGRHVLDAMPDWTCDAVLRKALHAVTALYPREAFDAVSGFTTGVPWEDWDLQLKLARDGWCSRRLAAPVWVYSKDTGTRREQHYAHRDEAKTAMLATWGPYIEGRIKLAGCSSCGGSRTQTVFAAPAPARNAQFLNTPQNMPDAVMIEYIGPKDGKQSFRGHATNIEYQFQTGRPRWVNPRDAEFFLTTPDAFRRVPTPKQGEPTAVTSQAPVMTEQAPALTAPGRFRGRAAAPTPEPVEQAPPPAAPIDAAIDLPPPPPAVTDLPPAPPAPPAAAAQPAATRAPLTDLPAAPAPVARPSLAALPKVETPAAVTPEEEGAAAAEALIDAGEMVRVPVDDSGIEIDPDAAPAEAAPPPAKPAAAATRKPPATQPKPRSRGGRGRRGGGGAAK